MPYTLDVKKKQAPPLIKKKQIPPFAKKPRGITMAYERALRGIAREIGRLVKGYVSDDPLDATTITSLTQVLRQYADIISPWALHLVNNVFRSVDNADRTAWREHSKNMALALRKELDEAPVGDTLTEIMRQNVLLIKSIPLEAAERVHKLVQENMMQSRRASEVAEMIMKTESVTKNRATLIARTEISKASTALTQSRALFVGSDGYVWRTTGDMIVRKSHKSMNGKFVKWAEPATLDNMTGHAGGFPNCRCWTDVIVPEG